MGGGRGGTCGGRQAMIIISVVNQMVGQLMSLIILDIFYMI